MIFTDIVLENDLLALPAFQNYRFFSLDSVFREDGERDDPISLDLFGSKSISKSEYLFRTICFISFENHFHHFILVFFC